jgi:hypothetical protein
LTPDFTLKIYRTLIQALQYQGFAFQPFCEFLERPAGRAAALRHDVDKRPHYALKMARLEHKMGIRGTYYFRCMPVSWDGTVMHQIAEMGHEIGYHYEDLTLVNGDHGQAIQHFEQQLSRLREIYPVKTICMHGSPLSKHDNRDLWKHYNYHDYGIIGEPYFDVDFSKVLYLTDTGRRWDGEKVSVRDKVEKSKKSSMTFRSTKDIITAAEQGLLPDQIMITLHPQRWTDKPLPWLQEFMWQNVKNVAKRALMKMKHA